MALAIDQSVSVAASSGTSITTGTFSTTTANELFVAFVSSDAFFNGSSVRLKVSDSTSMAWLPLGGEATQGGPIQVFYALATATKTNMTVTATMNAGSSSGDRISLLVVTFTGHNTSTPIGAVAVNNNAAANPSITLTTVGANSWVWGAESDVTSNTTTTAGTNQTKQYQDASASGHGSMTVWKQNSTTTTAGTSVTMNLTGISGDSYDGIAFEIIDAASNQGTSLILDNISHGDYSLGVGGTATLAHTCNGSNRVLFVLIACDDSNETNHQTSSVTYSGVSMTNLRIDDQGTEYRTEIWYLVNPASGNNNVVVTLSSINYVGVYAVSFQNASQSAPSLSNGDTLIHTGSLDSVSITTTVANSWAIGITESQASAYTNASNNGRDGGSGWNQSFQQSTLSVWPLLGATGSKTFQVNNLSSGVAFSVGIVSPIVSSTFTWQQLTELNQPVFEKMEVEVY